MLLAFGSVVAMGLPVITALAGDLGMVPWSKRWRPASERACLDWRKALGPLPRQHGMLGVMLREGQPLRLADIRADPRFEGGWPSSICSTVGSGAPGS